MLLADLLIMLARTFGPCCDNNHLLQVSGYSPPKPCVAFAHFGFDDELMALIRKSEFSQPTPIQSQAIPVALSGRDIIGIAKTGSGKTAAFLWPLLAHAIDQPELKEEDGPIGLILAPTRELCQQVRHDSRYTSTSVAPVDMK